MPSIPPFDLPGAWLRGNLHCHSRESDGALSPQDVWDEHRRAGYDFFALTDHDRITELSPGQPGPLVLRGAEITLGRSRQGSPMHCVAVGLQAPALPASFPSPSAALEWVWDGGAFPVLAHPHWSGFASDELASLAGLRAVEIFNYGCARENDKGHALVYWDDLLGRGQTILGVAADDSHWRDSDFGGGWVMVQAETPSTASIVEGLRRGRFYSTCGPQLLDLQLEGDRLVVRTSPAAAIFWIGAGRLGWSRHAPPGVPLTEAEFQLKGRPAWIRVEICDAAGRWAWSNPFSIPPN